jgi:tetraacyldisaccharide 4'-kinase
MCGRMEIIERYPAAYRILSGRGKWAALRPVRWMLAELYGLWLRARGAGAPGGRGRGRAGTAGSPLVVSIGNLEVGGGGKTPCTLLLATALAARGARPVVVTRAYRSLAERRAPCVVAASGALSSEPGEGVCTEEGLLALAPRGETRPAFEARSLGDEVLLYRSRGIPVVIDPDRGRGALLARRLFAPTHLLLDDAFQNGRVAKDVEILLLDAERPFGDGRLFPLGTLRERPSAARRADIVIFSRAREARVPMDAEPFVSSARLFFARHEPRDLLERSGRSAPLSRLAGRECVLFSGVARPASFERAAEALGARARAAFRFIDHHAYSPGDIARMLEAGGEGGAYVTTEKDWAKAAWLFPREAEVLALRVEMRIEGLEGLLDALATASS